MTKDFRHVGRLPAEAAPPSPGTTAAAPAAARGLILLLIQVNALAFLAAGIWFLAGGASPFPPEITELFGYFCLAAAAADLVPILILKRRWRQATTSRR